MKTNDEGKSLIYAFSEEYELAASRTVAEKAVNLLVRVRINNNQFSALVSLVTCIGVDEFKKSRILKTLNKGYSVGAAQYFDTYIHEIDDEGNKIVCHFLSKQREFERDLYLKPELVAKTKRGKK